MEVKGIGDYAKAAYRWGAAKADAAYEYVKKEVKEGLAEIEKNGLVNCAPAAEHEEETPTPYPQGNVAFFQLAKDEQAPVARQGEEIIADAEVTVVNFEITSLGNSIVPEQASITYNNGEPADVNDPAIYANPLQMNIRIALDAPVNGGRIGAATIGTEHGLRSSNGGQLPVYVTNTNLGGIVRKEPDGTCPVTVPDRNFEPYANLDYCRAGFLTDQALPENERVYAFLPAGQIADPGTEIASTDNVVSLWAWDLDNPMPANASLVDIVQYVTIPRGGTPNFAANDYTATKFFQMIADFQ